MVALSLTSLILQAPPSPIAVLGTVGLLALFLSLTAHLAARNVIGDVDPIKALGVGVVPAVVSLATQLLNLPSGIGVAVALLLDGVAIHYLYDQPRRISIYTTAIHVIITIILGVVIGGIIILVGTTPG